MTSLSVRYPSAFLGRALAQILYLLDFFVRYLAKVRSFWKVPPHQTVGVPVQPAFMGLIMSCEAESPRPAPVAQSSAPGSFAI